MRSRRIVVIGAGHVGLVTAAALAHIGHHVVGLDDDAAKVAALQAGVMPFYEEGLQALVDAGQAGGHLVFAGNPEASIAGAEVAFICVGTPGRPNGEPNLVAVEHAASAVARWASRDMVVVEKSTVPVQTAEWVRLVLSRSTRHRFEVASNPEFLREGAAVEDSLRPDRILVGADSAVAHGLLRELYAPIVDAGAQYFATDVATAELAKHACNAFLALKISFANGLARVCEASGADVVAIADIMGADPRIGRAFLNAGLGYGGFCFPKDLAAFRSQATRLGYDFSLLDEVVKLNDEALDAIVGKVRAALWNLEGKRVGVLGLAFKPGTDDIRDSPALRLAGHLMEAGAQVAGADPAAGSSAVAALPGLELADGPYAAATGAHCLVVATDWPEYGALDLARIREVMAIPIIIDARNLLDPEEVAAAGFAYYPTGRPPQKPAAA
ncbi:MAG TPA: UDP-glucose/GDP-mannose dehydrogenase family protein [Actinomycetota bacterium]|nr:UDP-glucose/GDP-mannose dehydrogenase family protein [Actinomycetota bacterium]